MFCGVKSYNTCSNAVFWHSSSSHMRVMRHNWSATKQRLHPQSIAEISHHSVLSGGQDSTMWNNVWVSPQGHRSVSVSRHFLLETPQCPCSVRKRFSRDHCCRGESKPALTPPHNHFSPHLLTCQGHIVRSQPTQKYAVHMHQVATVVMESTQLVLSQL